MSRISCIFLTLALTIGMLVPRASAAEAHPPAPALAAVVIDPASPRVELLRRIHLLFAPVAEVPAALDASRYHLAIIDATPANLALLQQHATELDRFTGAGGWVMLWGVTPAGLPTFDKLVGVDHIMRPFGMEQVAAAETPSPYSAGIVSNDLAMRSSKWTPGPANVQYRSDDAWSYVVDLEDIAPFCELPPPAYWGRPAGQIGTDSWPRNMISGIDDYWRFSFTIPLGKPQYTDWQMKLPSKQLIDGFSIERESIFSRVTKVRLSFPGTEAKPIDLDVTKDTRQDFSFPSVSADRVDLALSTDGKNKALTGVRTIRLHIARGGDYAARVCPLVSVGVLVAYPRGAGGIVLNEMNVPASESLPVNSQHKAIILNALLRNLHGAFDPAAPVPPRKIEWAQKGKEWDDPANWLGNVVPGKSDIACFPAAHNSVAAVDPAILNPAEVGGIEFDNDFGGPRAEGAHPIYPGVKGMNIQNMPSWIIRGPSRLSIGAIGLRMSGQHAGTDLISCPLFFAADQTWIIGDNSWEPNILIMDQYGNNNNLVLTGALSGPGAWTKEGSGRLYYVNNTSPEFTGGVTIRGTALEWALTKLATGGTVVKK